MCDSVGSDTYFISYTKVEGDYLPSSTSDFSSGFFYLEKGNKKAFVCPMGLKYTASKIK